MRTRTAIIILLILAVILFGVVFYLIQTKVQTNNKQPVSGQSQQVKQLTPEQKIINAQEGVEGLKQLHNLTPEQKRNNATAGVEGLKAIKK